MPLFSTRPPAEEQPKEQENAEERPVSKGGTAMRCHTVRQQVIKNAKAGDAKALAEYRDFAQMNQLFMPD